MHASTTLPQPQLGHKRSRVPQEASLTDARKSLDSLTTLEVKDMLVEWTSITDSDAPWMGKDFHLCGKDLSFVERLEDLQSVLGPTHFSRIPAIQLRRVFYEIKQLQECGLHKQPLVMSENLLHLKLKVDEIVNLLYSTNKKRCKQFGKCVCYYVLSMQQQDLEFNYALGRSRDFLTVVFDMAGVFEHVNSVMVLAAVMEVACNFVQPIPSNPDSIIVSNQEQLTHEHLVWLLNAIATYLNEYDKPHFLQYAAKLLSLMPWHVANHLHDVMAVSNGYQVLMRLLTFHHEKEIKMELSIVKYAASALSKLALHPNHRASLGSHGGCEAAIAVLKAHRVAASTNLHSYDIVYSLCCTLEDLALNTANEGKLGELGGCALVVDLVRQHEAHGQDAILEHACGALWNLSVREEHKRIIASLGGCCWVDVLQTHIADAAIVERVVAALWSLAMDVDNRVVIGDLGTCELLVGLLSDYDAHNGILVNACGGLKSLACELQNKQRIVDCGGLEKLVSLLERHTDNADLTKYCCWALKNIASKKCPQVLEALACSPGVEDTLKSVIRQHGESDSAGFAKDLLERIWRRERLPTLST